MFQLAVYTSRQRKLARCLHLAFVSISRAAAVSLCYSIQLYIVALFALAYKNCQGQVALQVLCVCTKALLRRVLLSRCKGLCRGSQAVQVKVQQQEKVYISFLPFIISLSLLLYNLTLLTISYVAFTFPSSFSFLIL